MTSQEDSSKLSDEQLVEGILMGQGDLRRELYNRYSNLIFGRCFSLTKDHAASEDLVHDVFIKIFLKLNTFKGKSRFSLWVHSITYNHCINYLKKKARRSEQSFEEVNLNEIESAAGQDEDKLLLEIQLQQLERVFQNLKATYKSVLLLYYKDQLSIKEIADVLKIGESAVKMRLKRGRDQLSVEYKKMTHGSR